MKKEILDRCSFCGVLITEPKKLIGGKAEVDCYCCKVRKGTKYVPKHKLCDPCFLAGHAGKNTYFR